MARNTLSPRMIEALQRVPDEWAPVKCRFWLSREFISHPLFRRTYAALRTRELVEFRCTDRIGETRWEWRRTPSATACRDYTRTVDADEQIVLSCPDWDGDEPTITLREFIAINDDADKGAHENLDNVTLDALRGLAVGEEPRHRRGCRWSYRHYEGRAMITLGGKPRYEIRDDVQPGTGWVAWDTERDCVVHNSGSRFQRDVTTTVAVLNQEYQRWLTDRFYDLRGAA